MSEDRTLTPDDRQRPSDLDWQAWCYVSGEMTSDESAAFEARLADDLAACEAVARAVELNDALAAVALPVARNSVHSAERPAGDRWPGRGRSPRRQAPWLPRLGWMAAGAAACLTLILLVRWDGSHDVAVVEHERAEHDAGDLASRLAQAWTEVLGSDVADEEDPNDSAGQQSFGESLAYIGPGELGVTASDDSVAPDWLLAALDEGDSNTDPTDQAPAEPPMHQAVPN